MKKALADLTVDGLACCGSNSPKGTQLIDSIAVKTDSIMIRHYGQKMDGTTTKAKEQSGENKKVVSPSGSYLLKM